MWFSTLIFGLHLALVQLAFNFVPLVQAQSESSSASLVQPVLNPRATPTSFPEQLAGAYIDPGPNVTFTGLSGRLVVPEISVDPNIPLSDAGYGASLLIAMGLTTPLQAGVLATINKDGDVIYNAFCAWTYGNGWELGDNGTVDIGISSGNTIEIGLSMPNDTTASVTIRNNGNMPFTTTLSVPEPSSSLTIDTQRTVFWGVQDFGINDETRIPLVNFSTASFSDCTAVGYGLLPNGYESQISPAILDDGGKKAITDTSIGAGQVNVSYLGPRKS